MSGANDRDPMQMMRDAYAQGIERWSTAMEEIVGSEDFASASGQLLALYAQQQQAIRAATRVAAENIQMPTTEDLAEVAQLVINVERKVDEVTDQSAEITTRLGAIEATLAEAATGAQALSARLSAIEDALTALARPAAAVAPAAAVTKAPAAKAPAVAKKPAVAKSAPARRRTPRADG